jgi:hypothetical protein
MPAFLLEGCACKFIFLFPKLLPEPNMLMEQKLKQVDH